MDISVLVPVKDPPLELVRTQDILARSLRNLSFRFEILVLDYARSKQSQEVLEKIASDIAQVTVVSSQGARNFRSAIQELIGLAQGSILIYLDPQKTFDFSMLPIFLDKLKACDIVVASRYKSFEEKKMGLSFLEKFYYFFCREFLKIPVYEMTPNLIAMHRKVTEGIILTQKNKDIFFELLKKAYAQEFSIQEVSDCFCLSPNRSMPSLIQACCFQEK